MVRAPESPWSLRATRTLPGVSGISPSLLESFLAAPRSLLESWGNAGVSLESPSVPRVSLESFPVCYAGWIETCVNRYWNHLSCGPPNADKEKGRQQREGMHPVTGSGFWETHHVPTVGYFANEISTMLSHRFGKPRNVQGGHHKRT